MAKDVAAVVAAAYPSRGIGYQGNLPWKSLPPDMKRFKDLTSRTTNASQRGGGISSGINNMNTLDVKNAVVMGRKTWESIPPKFRPLPNRWNVVLTTNPSAVGEASSDDDTSAVRIECDLELAMSKLQDDDRVDKIFVIGGGQVYRQALDLGLVNRIYYTEVANLPGSSDDEAAGTAGKFDTYFPELDEKVWRKVDAAEAGDKENGLGGPEPSVTTGDGLFLVDGSSGLHYRFVEYRRRNVEELQYLDLCRDIMEGGVRRGDRTGTGTLSKFGTQMRFSLRNGRLPLLTTKRTFWRGVAEELLWFISGCTNANVLAEKDIHIWDGNGSREFLDKRGLGHREVGDLGPVYGFQWRHFGAAYVDMHADYTGQGVDQLKECIDKIVNHPEDRRIIMSAWNPADLDLMALPPCHMFCQFYVDTERNELSCQMYQRSADLGLGVPFNIASYALLTHMVAHVTGRKAGEFIHTIGDAHVYLNHIDALREQLAREPRDFPTLRINPDKTDIDGFVLDDFVVEGYNPHKTIKMKMAV